MDEPSCPGCRELLKRLSELEARIRELEAERGRNASNSSPPPSANPPEAPPPVRKKPTGRKPGGQPRRSAPWRARLPAERGRRTHHLVPAAGECCPRDLPAAPAPDDREPRWHQVLELPKRPVIVTEYQAHGRTCRSCGQLTWEQ